MKVALDFRSIPFSGIWNYSNQLMDELRERGVEVLPLHLPTHLVRASSLAYMQGFRRLAWENFSMPLDFKRTAVDLFHCTNNYGIPFLMSGPSVLTLHDFIPLMMRDVYLPQYRKWVAYRTFLGYSVRAATRIIAISDFTRNELERRFPGAGKKTRRIYHGCGRQYRKLTDNALLDRTVSRLGLPEDFVLTVGGTEPRKNVFRLVELFRERWNEGRKTPTLAVVGGPWRGCGTDCWQLPPNVLSLGHVEAEELIHLYNRCKVFIFPSLLEGFGLPILEAMGCGAPVLAMKASSIPEVTGDAAMLADPNSACELARCLGQLLEDGALRRELTARGYERAAVFSWSKTAALTMDVYREAINGR